MSAQAASAATRKPARRAAAPAAHGKAAANNGKVVPGVEPDLDRAVVLVIELMGIPGRSGDEQAVAQRVRERLLAAGAPADAITFDDAGRRTPLAGNCGNMALKLPGTVKAPRRLLMAHLDTVPICVGAQPVRRGEFVVSANPATGLGGDDRAGATAILVAALEILERKLPHPPLTFLWTVQEEVGLHGARHARIGPLGKPALAFNWDGGAPSKLTIGATGGYRMKIDIRGLASHAGGAPEQGISAIAIASLAIADLATNGWHGLIEKGRSRGTSNVGVIRGGEATNVVTDHVELQAEARSHDPKFRLRIVKAIEDAFRRAVKQIKNSAGKRGSVAFDGRLDYESFALPSSDPSVQAARAAVAELGLEAELAISNGGLDANWMFAHGIPTVTLGCGQSAIHTTSERLDLAGFRNACRIALRLATGG